MNIQAKDIKCPSCGSDQTTACEIRPAYFYVECVNCDKENYVDDGFTAYAEMLDAERGRSRGRR